MKSVKAHYGNGIERVRRRPSERSTWRVRRFCSQKVSINGGKNYLSQQYTWQAKCHIYRNGTDRKKSGERHVWIRYTGRDNFRNATNKEWEDIENSLDEEYKRHRQIAGRHNSQNCLNEEWKDTSLEAVGGNNWEDISQNGVHEERKANI